MKTYYPVDIYWPRSERIVREWELQRDAKRMLLNLMSFHSEFVYAKTCWQQDTVRGGDRRVEKHHWPLAGA